MQFSTIQSSAVDSVRRWFEERPSQVFRLFGYAGTGKTTLAKEFAAQVDGTIIFCAYTGKAAHVLRSKGCENATTIHKCIYRHSPKSRTIHDDLVKTRDDLAESLKSDNELKLSDEEISKHPDIVKLEADIAGEAKRLKRPSFSLNPDAPIALASLVVVDECSMVDQVIGHDLLSFDVPVLVLGDPAQLPPVKGAGFFTNCEPDICLTEIHRQSQGNPILDLAFKARNKQLISCGHYGESKVIKATDIDKEEVMDANQIIVGTNKKRAQINNRMRELFGRNKTPFPVAGDKLVCLRNDHEIGLLNGSMWTVEDSVVIDHDVISLQLLEIQPKCDENVINRLSCEAHTAYFLGKEPPFWAVKEYQCFDFGYALTAHKTQGSQYDHVYLFDESRCFRHDAWRWLYTAITRAAEKITIVM